MNFLSNLVTGPFLLSALIFTVCCLVQNAMFTWSSRSRNSGDPSYHRFAAWASNGIYYITNALVTVFIVKYSQWWALALQGVLYTIAASEGSVFMMRQLLKREKGKQSVGHSAKFAQIPTKEWEFVRAAVMGTDTPTPDVITAPQGNVDKDFELAVLRKRLAEKGLSTEVKPSESEQSNSAQEGTPKAV